MTKSRREQESAFREALAGIGLSDAVIEKMVERNRDSLVDEPNDDVVLAGIMRRLLENFAGQSFISLPILHLEASTRLSEAELEVVERTRRG